jgi:hypothetical protein
LLQQLVNLLQRPLLFSLLQLPFQLL